MKKLILSVLGALLLVAASPVLSQERGEDAKETSASTALRLTQCAFKVSGMTCLRRVCGYGRAGPAEGQRCPGRQGGLEERRREGEVRRKDDYAEENCRCLQQEKSGFPGRAAQAEGQITR